MPCQILISAYDHRQPSPFWPEFRPFKQRTGEPVYVKDYIGPWKPIWGRMEGPKGGNLILEVSDASKAETGHYIHKITNRPSLRWGSRGDGMQVVATLPDLPGAELTKSEQQAIREIYFPRTASYVDGGHMVFELKTKRQIDGFDRYFKGLFTDLFMRYGGPRWVLDTREVQKIAWDGGYGKCDLQTLKRFMVDRTRSHLVAEPIRELAA